MAVAISKQTLTCFLLVIIFLVSGIGVFMYCFHKIGSLCSKPQGPVEAEENWTLWGFISYFYNPGDNSNSENKIKLEQFCYEGYMSAFLIILHNHFIEDLGHAGHSTYNTFLDVILWIVTHFVKHSILFVIILSIIFVVLLTLRTNSKRKFHHDSAINSNIAIFDDSMDSLSSPPPRQNFLYEKSGGKTLQTFIFQHVSWLSRITIFAMSLSIPWEFIHLYQKGVADRAVTIGQGFPSECNPQSQSLYESLTSLLRYQFSWSHRNDPCKKYYHALLVDPFWEVTPLMVLSSVFTRCLLHPLETISLTLGRSVGLFFSEIPVHWQLVFVLFVMALCLLLILMLCRYSFHVPMILRFEPGPRLNEQATIAQNNSINKRVIYEPQRNSRKEEFGCGVISTWQTGAERKRTSLSSSKGKSKKNDLVASPFQTDIWASEAEHNEAVTSLFHITSGTMKGSKSVNRNQCEGTDPEKKKKVGTQAVQSTSTNYKQDGTQRKRGKKQKQEI